jgi:uncharacterized PurR-regulated membrane protein YhhQ (DUF165 family)
MKTIKKYGFTLAVAALVFGIVHWYNSISVPSWAKEAPANILLEPVLIVAIAFLATTLVLILAIVIYNYLEQKKANSEAKKFFDSIKIKEEEDINSYS